MRTFFLCMAAALCVSVQGRVVLPPVLGDNAVLEQLTDVNLWGEAAPLSPVTIKASWLPKAVRTQADSSGRWLAKVATPAASYTPHSFTVKDRDNSVTSNNILIGEVWMCSGQSNMEMTLGGNWCAAVENAAATIATASEKPGVRMFTVKRRGALEPVAVADGQWLPSNTANAPGFSAVAYHYASWLNRVLQVPVGIVSCAWGGTSVEGWLPREILEDYADIKIPVPEDCKNGYWHHHTPMVMYYGMISPLRNCTVRGWLWYQGETNAGRPETYAQRLQAMVQRWRADWQQPQAPFYIVEIAPYDYASDYGPEYNAAYLRRAQHEASKAIGNSGFVCTNDLVYPHETTQIHPCRKEEVGQRAAWQALNKTYGYKTIACESPVFRKMTVRDTVAVLDFDHAEGGFDRYLDIQGFEVAGADSVFHPAQAMVRPYQRTVQVWSEHVKNPVAVRYGWGNFVPGNLRNSFGLPVVPFSTL